MLPIKTIVEIRYTKTPIGLDFRRKLLEIIAGEDKEIPNKLPPFKEGLVVTIKKRKMKVAVESNRTAVDLEDPKSSETILENISGMFKRINEAIKCDNITRLGVRTIWLNKTGKPFAKIVNRFKQRFYLKNPVSDKAEDVAVYFTLKDNGNKINYAAGPIEKEELRSKYAIFSNIKLPKRAVLADVDYYTLTNFNFSGEHLAAFLKKALEYAGDINQKTERVLR